MVMYKLTTSVSITEETQKYSCENIFDKDFLTFFFPIPVIKKHILTLANMQYTCG